MKVILDFLACPACGCPFTEGRFCNLTCARKLEAEAKKEGAKALRFVRELDARARDFRPVNLRGPIEMVGDGVVW